MPRKEICVKKVEGAERGEHVIRVVLEDGTELEVEKVITQGPGCFRTGGNKRLGVHTWFETFDPVWLFPGGRIV